MAAAAAEAGVDSIYIDNTDTLIIISTNSNSLIDTTKVSLHRLDSTIVMYQGEESGTMRGTIDYPFSIGNGDTHDNSNNYNGWGWHMHSDGRVKRISVGGTGTCTGGAVVELYVDELPTGQTITVAANGTFAKKAIDYPVNEDSVINMKVTTGCTAGAADWVAYMSVKVSVHDY
jgi:hypothetical protein